jgi:AraC family transcriptional regulator of adaptative response/methylated-DNA-[protein]-cysteine methyltransferase
LDVGRVPGTPGGVENMTTMEQLEDDYQRIERAIHFIEGQALRQPSLGEIAAEVGLSEFHSQRLFSRWDGISPKRFLQFLTKE